MSKPNGKRRTLPSRDTELPEGWAAALMGDVAKVIGGGTPRSTDPDNFVETGHPWITPADLSGFDGMWIKRGRRSLSDQGLAESSARLLPVGSVLMSSRAPIGYVAIAANELCTNQGFKSFVLEEGLDPQFVFYWLRFKRPEIESMGRGSTFTELSAARSREIPIIVPPLPEQKRIAAKVEALLERANAARARVEKLPPIVKRFRQSVLAAAVSGRLTEDWRDIHQVDETADELLNRLQTEREARWRRRNPNRKYRPPVAVADEDLASIPETWAWTNFDHCSWEITVGHVGPMMSRYVDEGIPFLRSQNVRPLRFDPTGLVFIDPAFHSILRKSALFGGEIVVTRSGANTGDCCVYPKTFGKANCADLVVTRPLSGLIPTYGAIYVSSPEGQARIGLHQTGIAQPHFNIGAMRVKAFPLPPLAEQREIVRRVESALLLADTLEKRVAAAAAKIEQASQSILVKAFRGELVWTEAELASREGRGYEPASVVLARIREVRNRYKFSSRGGKRMAHRSSHQQPKTRKPLDEVLRDQGKPLTPERLFALAGFDENSVDAFYEELRKLVGDGRVRESRPKSKKEITLEVVVK